MCGLSPRRWGSPVELELLAPRKGMGNWQLLPSLGWGGQEDTGGTEEWSEVETGTEETWGWGVGCVWREKQAGPRDQGEKKPGGWTLHGVGGESA